MILSTENSRIISNQAVVLECNNNLTRRIDLSKQENPIKLYQFNAVLSATNPMLSSIAGISLFDMNKFQIRPVL